MKYFLAIILFSQIGLSSVDDFLILEDREKIIFLETKTTLVEDSKQFSQVNESLMKQLILVGKNEADIWGDTVLEGPYALNGDVSVELEGLYVLDNQTYALAGYISAPAVITEDDECSYNEETSQWTEQCYEGQIYQHFIMGVDGKVIESDNYPETDF